MRASLPLIPDPQGSVSIEKGHLRVIWLSKSALLVWLQGGASITQGTAKNGTDPISDPYWWPSSLPLTPNRHLRLRSDAHPCTRCGGNSENSPTTLRAETIWMDSWSSPEWRIWDDLSIAYPKYQVPSLADISCPTASLVAESFNVLSLRYFKDGFCGQIRDR